MCKDLEKVHAAGGKSLISLRFLSLRFLTAVLSPVPHDSLPPSLLIPTPHDPSPSVGKGIWHARNRPEAVPPRERAIVVHKGGWTYICDPHVPRGAVIDADLPHLLNGIARGDIVAQAVPQCSEDPETCQRFALIGCLPRQEIAYVTITREKGQIIFMHGIRLDLRIDGQEEVRG